MLAIITAITLSACAGLTSKQPASVKSEHFQKYTDAREQCKTTAAHELKFGDLSTYGMNEAVDKQIKCYESVAHKIIDDHYASSAIKMKQDLADFISKSYSVSGAMYYPDECTPFCGTMATNLTRGTTLGLVEKYLDALIHSMDIYING